MVRLLNAFGDTTHQEQCSLDMLQKGAFEKNRTHMSTHDHSDRHINDDLNEYSIQCSFSSQASHAKDTNNEEKKNKKCSRETGHERGSDWMAVVRCSYRRCMHACYQVMTATSIRVVKKKVSKRFISKPNENNSKKKKTDKNKE